MDNAAKDRVVLVLGMHRSGTSVSTAMLRAIGLNLSDELIPAADENPIGYFESAVITAVHDDLLATFGNRYYWWTSTTLDPLPEQWWKLPHVAPFKERLFQEVRKQLDASGGFWGFKDPRTARLLPLWNELLDEMGVDARYLLVTRDPAEVAASLYARQKMSRAYAELLWLEHNTDAVVHGGARLRAVIDYRNWFEDPAKHLAYLAERLDLPQPAPDQVARAIDEYISDRLRHNRASGSACVLPYTQNLYNALLARDMASISMLAQLFSVTHTFTKQILRMQREGTLIGAAQ